MTRDEMDRVTAGLPTKSAKIRALSALGVARAEIANYLQIRYQHVRNVLVAPAPSAAREPQASGPPKARAEAGRPITIEEAKLGLAAQFGVPPSAIEITIRG